MDIGPITALPFDHATLDRIATVEYRAVNDGPVIQRNGSVGGVGWKLPAGATVLDAVRLLSEDIVADAGSRGPITGAVLQASDGALYVTRASASTNLAPIGPMPLDATGFSHMPLGTGGMYDSTHVRVTPHQDALKALVGYGTYVDTTTVGAVAVPQPIPAT